MGVGSDLEVDAAPHTGALKWSAVHGGAASS